MKGAPLPVLTILALYACLCKFGPILMADRKPFDLKKIMIAYNILQITYNTLGSIYVIYFVLWKNKFNYSCQEIDYSNSERGIIEMWLVYSYFLNKVSDLLDTVSQLVGLAAEVFTNFLSCRSSLC
jgi:hypothetical protein